MQKPRITGAFLFKYKVNSTGGAGHNWAGMYCHKPDMTDSDYSTSAHAHCRRRDKLAPGDSAVGDDGSVAVEVPNSGNAACIHPDNAGDGDAIHGALHDNRNIEHSPPEPVHLG